MTSPSDTLNDTADMPSATSAPAAPMLGRAFFWSVRRELWENRSIWIAPLVAAGVVLLGFLFAVGHLPHHLPTMQIDKGERAVPPEAPYGAAALVIIVTSLVVGVLYSLSALNGERRDRTILFWKSLPVSDLTAVLAKVFVPLVVMPLVTFGVIFITQLAILALSFSDSGNPVAALWTHVDFAAMTLAQGYVLVVLALWYAPVWGWSLMVGGWARRVAFLWAAGVPLAIGIVEKFAMGTSHVFHLIGQRLGGGLAEAFASSHGGPMGVPQIDMAGFVSSPGLWVGLAVGAAFTAVAVWQRRYRDPM